MALDKWISYEYPFYYIGDIIVSFDMKGTISDTYEDLRAYTSEISIIIYQENLSTDDALISPIEFFTIQDIDFSQELRTKMQQEYIRYKFELNSSGFWNIYLDGDVVKSGNMSNQADLGIIDKSKLAIVFTCMENRFTIKDVCMKIPNQEYVLPDGPIEYFFERSTFQTNPPSFSVVTYDNSTTLDIPANLPYYPQFHLTATP